MNTKMIEGLKRYRENIANGTIDKPVTLTPTQKAIKYPKSLRLAINAKCYECSNGSKTEVRDCHIDDCALFMVRPWQKKDIAII